MKTYGWLWVWGLLVTAQADVQLNGMFTDNMVLQRNQPVPVWGMADPGEKVMVEFAGQKQMASANSDGSWMVHLTSMNASSNPRKLTISSSNNSAIQLSNLLVGDVWLCAGQSNMDHPFSTYSLLKDSINEVNLPSIRLLALEHVSGPQLDCAPFDKAFRSGWQACRARALGAFSPVGYYFGNALHRELDVPVGLVESAWGGTRIEPWMSRDPEGNSGRLYNAMIHPLQPFAFKGVIWYQGESNAREPVEYAVLFADLIQQWRAVFGQPDMAFYFVQLAPFHTLEWNTSGAAWAWLRESQSKALELPNTGMAVITDLGEFGDIHPQNKQPVGERLARFALKAEGRAIETDGPVFQNMELRRGRCVLEFSHVVEGLSANRVVMNKNRNFPVGADAEAFVVEAGNVKGFVVCGADGNFVPAVAKITGKDRIEVWSSDVESPVAVRYGWANFPLCNLFNSEGLPASPFRTDAFPPPNFDGSIIGMPLVGDAPSGWSMDSLPAPNEVRSEQVLVAGRKAHHFSHVENSKVVMAYWKGANNALRNGAVPSQVVNVLYFDEGKGMAQMLYDSSDAHVQQEGLPAGVWKSGGAIKLTDSKTWRVAEFRLEDAMFAGRCNGADLRIQSTRSLTLGGIFIQEGR